MSVSLGIVFAISMMVTVLLVLVAPKLWQKILAIAITAVIITLVVIFYHSWWMVAWAALISLGFFAFVKVKAKDHKVLKALLGIIVLALVIGGIFFVLPTTYLDKIAAENPAEAATYVCADPSAVAYGSYALVAEEAIKGPAIIEWWDQTPAAYDKKTGKLDLSAMKGHEGIQFLMSGETTTPADGIVGTVFVLTSDNDLLCVKNQHLLAFYSKPQHIYAKSPDELILPVPTAVPTK